MGGLFGWRATLLAGAVAIGGHAVAQPPEAPDAAGSVPDDGVRHGRVGPMADDARRPAVAWTWTRSGALRRVDRDGVVWDHGPDGARRVGELGEPLRSAAFADAGRRLFALTEDCRGLQVDVDRATAPLRPLRVRPRSAPCDDGIDVWGRMLAQLPTYGPDLAWLPRPAIRRAATQAWAREPAPTVPWPCEAPAPAPDGRQLACDTPGDTVQTWDLRDDVLRAVVPDPTPRATSLEGGSEAGEAVVRLARAVTNHPAWWLEGAGVHVVEVGERVLFVDPDAGRLLRVVEGVVTGVTDREIVLAGPPDSRTHVVDARTGDTVLVADGLAQGDDRGVVAIVGGRLVERSAEGVRVDLGPAPQGRDGPAVDVVGLAAERWAAVWADFDPEADTSLVVYVDRRGELTPVALTTTSQPPRPTLGPQRERGPHAYDVVSLRDTVHVFGAGGHLAVPVAVDAASAGTDRPLGAGFYGFDTEQQVLWEQVSESAWRDLDGLPTPSGPDRRVEDGRVRDADGRLHHQLFVFADGDWVVLRGDGTWSGRDRYGRVAVQTTSGVRTTLVDGRPWGTASGR